MMKIDKVTKKICIMYRILIYRITLINRFQLLYIEIYRYISNIIKSIEIYRLVSKILDIFEINTLKKSTL